MEQDGKKVIYFKFGLADTKRHGMFLSLQRYKVLMDCMEYITEALDDVMRAKEDVYTRLHIGGNVYIQVKSPYMGVDLREWYAPKGCTDPMGLKPCGVDRGLFFKYSEWLALYELNKTIENYVPELTDVICCRDSDSHRFSGWIKCGE